MAKRIDKPKTKVSPTERAARLSRKVAELKTELEKLPADRQEQLRRDLEREGGQ